MSRRARRVGGALVGAAAAWVLALAVFGWVGDGCVRDRARDRIAASMRASVAIGDLDVGPVTGVVHLRDVVIEKRELGYFRLAIASIDADVLPLGLALLDDGVGEVVVRGVDVDVSALGAFDLRGGGDEPIRFDRLELRDVHVTLEATSLVPGLARVDLTIERAVAGATTMRTPLSWLFALEVLTARLDLPAGLAVRVTFAADRLILSGGPFDTSVEIPFAIPELDPAREVEQLEAIARALAGVLAAELGARFLDDL